MGLTYSSETQPDVADTTPVTADTADTAVSQVVTDVDDASEDSVVVTTDASSAPPAPPIADFQSWRSTQERYRPENVHYTGDALKRRLGHIRGTIRGCDFRFRHANFETPTERVFTLRDVGLPSVLDQGELGSCTANGMANCIRVCEMRETGETSENVMMPSRLFVYYYSRLMEGNVDTDSGAEIRDVVKVVNKRGACNETEWPYDISQFTVEPTAECQAHAKAHRAVQYERVEQTAEALKTAIRTGFPVVFGFVVYDSIQRPSVGQTGIVPFPAITDKAIGGHCVILTGWDDNKRLFQFMNSWSDKWGDSGFGYLSYDYVLKEYLASDFWRITYVS